MWFTAVVYLPLVFYYYPPAFAACGVHASSKYKAKIPQKKQRNYVAGVLALVFLIITLISTFVGNGGGFWTGFLVSGLLAAGVCAAHYKLKFKKPAQTNPTAATGVPALAGPQTTLAMPQAS